MTADALSGGRQIAMALLRPGWEKLYYGRPEIEPVVCVGRILSHERLPDGKYNFLLQGTLRARIVREMTSNKSYRMAQVQPIVEKALLPSDQTELQARLNELLSPLPAIGSNCSAMLSQLAGASLELPDIADVIAFNCIEDVAIKQSLLAEPDMRIRISRTLDELEKLLASVQNAQTAIHRAHLN
jgi:Lon protease-like protein